MIYVLTDNLYLRAGIICAMEPIKVESLTAECCYASITSSTNDVYIIDDNVIYREVFSKKLHIANDVKVIFINTNKFLNINFLKINPAYEVFDREITLNEFRTKMIKAVTGKKRELSGNAKMILTPRERLILRDFINGKTAQEIAKATGLQDKTIYHYRKKACLKLGVERFLDMVPFRSSFLIASSAHERESTPEF